MNQTPTLLDSLLKETADRFGLPFESGSAGLEFEAGPFVANMLVHPVQPQQLLVQVAVMTLGEDTDPRLYRVMHQLNELARFEHEWIITVDIDGEVFLSRTVPIQASTAAMLEDLLGDAIGRAEHLQRALSQSVADPQVAASPSVPAMVVSAALRV